MTKDKFKFFEHTADAKFQAYGKTLEEAFSNAAFAMFSIMVDYEKVESKITKQITAEGSDDMAVLYNFLEELLFLLDTEGFLLNKVEKISIDNRKLKAKVVGDTDIDKYEVLGEVKAVTYNEMEIVEKDNDVMVQVVVDL
jgi:SHS2 domain-containing protein